MDGAIQGQPVAKAHRSSNNRVVLVWFSGGRMWCLGMWLALDGNGRAHCFGKQAVSATAGILNLKRHGRDPARPATRQNRAPRRQTRHQQSLHMKRASRFCICMAGPDVWASGFGKRIAPAKARALSLKPGGRCHPRPAIGQSRPPCP